MRNFIEDYLNDPSQAVSAFTDDKVFAEFGKDFDEEAIYAQIASPEFRLYEEMIFSDNEEDANFASVA